MIVYIKPRPSIPFEFEHMKPVPIEFDIVDDRISFDTFKCTGRYDSDGIQSIWVTSLMVGQWNSADISFTDDMKIITRGRFYLKAINSELCTLIGNIEFHDVSCVIEVEKLTREHESMKNINCLCTTAIARRPMVHYGKYNIGTVDKGTRSLRAISELKVEKIITNGPATIVFWNDGTKTVVKISDADMEDGKYDIYAGVSYAIAKKLFGSNSAFKREVDRKMENKTPVHVSKYFSQEQLNEMEEMATRLLKNLIGEKNHE